MIPKLRDEAPDRLGTLIHVETLVADHWDCIRDTIGVVSPDLLDLEAWRPLWSRKWRAPGRHQVAEKMHRAAYVILARCPAASAETEAGGGDRARADRPAWERLELKKQDGGDDLAVLDGKEYRLRESGYTMLSVLQTAKGSMILGSSLESRMGQRPRASAHK